METIDDPRKEEAFKRVQESLKKVKNKTVDITIFSNRGWFGAGWEACLKANALPLPPPELKIPEGYYKPGEKVQIREGQDEWQSCEIGFVYKNNAGQKYRSSFEILRKPAWTPKEGEAVFVRGANTVFIGRIEILPDYRHTKAFYVRLASGDGWAAPVEHLKPFDASKIGKPWSEI